MGMEDKSGNSTVIVPDGRDAQINRLVNAPDPQWGGPEDIEIWERPTDPFRIPKWCDQDRYEYAWLDPDDRHRPFEVALEDGRWAVVKRINHPSAPTEAFRTHGAVERGRQILVFRPADIGARMREAVVLRHADVKEGRMSGVDEKHYQITCAEGDKAERDKASGVVFAEEAAGAAKTSEEAKKTLTKPT